MRLVQDDPKDPPVWSKDLEAETNLDLAFDVHARESCSTWAFKMLAGFAGQDHDGALAILEEMLTFIVENELGSLCIRLKVQFFGDVPERHVRLVAKKTLLVWAQRDDDVWGGRGERATYALQMLHRAARRSRPTNMSMR